MSGLARLAAEATGGSAARLARYAQEQALAGEQAAAAGKPTSFTPKPVSVPVAPAIEGETKAPTLLAVETDSRQAVTVEEAESYGLTVEQAKTLAAWRNEQVVDAGPRPTIEATSSADLDHLSELGLLE